MKKKIFLLGLTLFLFSFNLFGAIGNVLAADEDYGLKTTAVEAGISTTKGGLATVIGKAIGYVLSLMGILFFLLALYGGFLWMTARGDHGQVEKAQSIIIDATVGLVVIAASYIITQFIFLAIK